MIIIDDNCFQTLIYLHVYLSYEKYYLLLLSKIRI